MNVVIIRYNTGNVASVQFALERVGISPVITNDHDIIRKADKVIFPGVGEAASAMRSLQATGLDQLIPSLQQPVLGICLGMQMLCAHSEEGDTKTLGVFQVNARRIAQPGQSGELKIPHVGWDSLTGLKSKLYKDIRQNEFVYYVHGYCVDICGETTAITNYVRPFSASLEKDNFYGVQYHPEKSSAAGEKIIRNFIEL